MPYPYMVEYANEITYDEIPLGLFNLEPEQVIPFLNAEVDGVEGIDTLLVSEMQVGPDQTMNTYALTYANGEWVIKKILVREVH